MLRLRGAAASAQHHVKQLLDEARDLTTPDALDYELTAFARHWNATDIAGALDGFLERPAADGSR